MWVCIGETQNHGSFWSFPTIQIFMKRLKQKFFVKSLFKSINLSIEALKFEIKPVHSEKYGMTLETN